MSTDAEKFYRRRKKLALTQSELADHLGVSQQAISAWEKGEREIPLMAWKLLSFIEATLDLK